VCSSLFWLTSYCTALYTLCVCIYTHILRQWCAAETAFPMVYMNIHHTHMYIQIHEVFDVRCIMYNVECLTYDVHQYTCILSLSYDAKLYTAVSLSCRASSRGISYALTHSLASTLSLLPSLSPSLSCDVQSLM